MPLMSDRDNCILFKSIDRADGKMLYEVKTVDHPECPLVKGVIRMTMFKCSLAWDEGSDLKLIEFSNFDMGGYFPARLMNMAMAGMM